MNLKTVNDLKDIKGKRVLVRLGLNAAIENGKVLGGYRIKQAIPTIKLLKARGAKVIAIGHIGRSGKETLKPVAEYINWRTKMGFVPTLDRAQVEKVVSGMKDGSAILLENLRSDSGEVSCDRVFGKWLAGLGDVYVNEAFPVSHRKHASIIIPPRYLPSYIGLQFEKEINHLKEALNPPHPFLFILGGAKIKTKLPLMKKFLSIADYVFVGGALANNFFAAKGYEVGRSLLDKDARGIAALMKNKKLLLPLDVVVSGPRGVVEKDPGEVYPSEVIVDAGHKTVTRLAELAEQSAYVLWNGPLGNYEKGFDGATASLLRALAKSDAKTIIGGGDTLTIAFNMKVHTKFDFVSTGGGAMLDYLADGKLPGIDVIEKSQKKYRNNF